jgi:ABC-type uncharacterized transport system auxiliary subunit
MNRAFAGIALSGALLLLACGGKILYPKYYSIDMPRGAAAVAVRQQIPGTLAVRRFDSSPYLRQKRIVYRPAPEEIGFYDYHHWVDDPAEMVTAAVVDSLRSAGLFRSVIRYDSRSQQDFLMAGRVERLEEVDYGGSVSVTAKLSADLLNLRTGETVWTDTATETMRVEVPNINSVVLQMSQAVGKSIDRLVLSLDQTSFGHTQLSGPAMPQQPAPR